MQPKKNKSFTKRRRGGYIAALAVDGSEITHLDAEGLSRDGETRIEMVGMTFACSPAVAEICANAPKYWLIARMRKKSEGWVIIRFEQCFRNNPHTYSYSSFGSALAKIKLMVDERKARECARDLLVSLLNESQLAQFQKGRSFEVIGSRGGKYTVDCTHLCFNVYGAWRRPGHSEHTSSSAYCVGIRNKRGTIPNFDTFVAQKIMLEADEDAFLSIANRD